jgi:hypothetical protein
LYKKKGKRESEREREKKERKKEKVLERKRNATFNKGLISQIPSN